MTWPPTGGFLFIQNRIFLIRYGKHSLNHARFQFNDTFRGIACADQLGVSGKLRELGIEVKGWGLNLTEALKDGVKILTL